MGIEQMGVRVVVGEVKHAQELPGVCSCCTACVQEAVPSHVLLLLLQPLYEILLAGIALALLGEPAAVTHTYSCLRPVPHSWSYVTEHMCWIHARQFPAIAQHVGDPEPLS
jgi:hypothetical protein